MNQYLGDRFEARDASGIVAAQMDDGPLPLMCESVSGSAQFALMLIQHAQSGTVVRTESMLQVRGVEAASRTVLLDSRLGTVTLPSDGLPASCFVPQPGESLAPFLVRAVSALLDSHDALALPAAA